MTPKADLSCHKTYKKWYCIIFYFKNEILHMIVFMVVLVAILNLTSRGHQRSRPFCLRWILKHNAHTYRFGGHFKFSSEVNVGCTHIVLRWIFETYLSYPTPYQLFKTDNLFPDFFYYYSRPLLSS